MDSLDFKENKDEYYLGEVRKLSRNAYRSIHNLLSEVVRNWDESKKRSEICRWKMPILPKQQRSIEGIRSMVLDFKFDVSDEFDVVKQGEMAKYVTIRMRRDNLFVVAYHNGLKWIQFSDQNLFEKTMVPPPGNLNFNGSYPSLQKKSNKDLDDVLVGHNQLFYSLRSLHHSKSKESDEKTVALSLLTFVIMFCETQRFHSIDEQIEKKWSTTSKLGDLVGIFKEWSTRSNEPAARDVKMLLNSSVEEEEEEDAAETSGKTKDKKNKNVKTTK